MSVTTTADEQLETARTHINEALQALNEIVVKECWGYSDFSDEKQEELEQAHITLLMLRKKLSG